MSSMAELFYTLIILFIFSSLLYFSGKSLKRVNKNPFASGEMVFPQRVQYLLPWLFSLIAFIAVDATVLLIVVSASTVNIVTIACLALVVLSFLLIPWSER